jgi:TatA/E family protein of Tat protein translocase
MGFAELLLLSLLVFLLFGPKKTPEIARKVGNAMGQLKRVSDDLQAQLVTESVSIMPERKATIDSTFAAWTKSFVAAPPTAGLLATTTTESGDNGASPGRAAMIDPPKTSE